MRAPNGKDICCCYWYSSIKPYYKALKNIGGKHYDSISYETDPSIDTYTAVFETQEQADVFKEEMSMCGWRHEPLLGR